jgi:hypothetical protein
MGDPFRRVQGNEPLVIPAAAWNACLDVAEAHRRNSHNQGQRDAQAVSAAGTDVTVRNQTGDDLGRLMVLGISGVAISEADNAEEFIGRPVLDGVTPAAATHAGRFVVTLEPIRADGLGRARLVGLVAVNVNITSTDHRCAEVTDANYSRLTSAATGSARILYAPAGTGVKRCLVGLGMDVELPAYPTTDGDYFMKLNKTGSVYTLTWGGTYDGCPEQQ